MVQIIDDKEIEAFFKTLKTRNSVSDGKYLSIVKDIINDVIINKDKALEDYTKKFDDKNFSIQNVEILKDDQEKAFFSLEKEMQEILIKAKDRIYDYHMHQKRNTFTYKGEFGEILGQKITPIENVGVYVPGGKAAYPSSVLMNIVPAMVAGVKNIVMCTPRQGGQVNPLVLACAYLCNVNHVYAIGGAQAIAAMAYGTESIKKVDKIVGPGNIFVALAKKEVYGSVGIDSIAGPSEILIVCDKSCNPKFVASDMLAQAEHDELASAIVICDDLKTAKEIQKWVETFYEESNRKDILTKSLQNYSKIIVVSSISEAIKLANIIAPEHLELAIDNAFNYLGDIQNAGAIFLGHYTPEAFGDYMAGPNHVLPTVQTARFFSPLGVDDFIKKSSIISFDEQSAKMLADDVMKFAKQEGLMMHALSAKLRGV